MTRALSTIAAAAVLLVPLAGCGETGPSEDPNATSVSTSDGFTTYDVPSEGFSIAVPESWRTASVDEALGEFDTEAVGEANPELGRLLEEIGSLDSLIKLIAFELPEGAFVTNLNVVVEPVPAGIGRERYFDLVVEGIEQIVQPSASVEQEEVALPAGPARLLRYEGFSTGTEPVATTQYVLFEGGRGYVLTYSTPASRLADHSAAFEQSAQTFRIG